MRLPHKLPDPTDVYTYNYDIAFSGVPYISIPEEPFMRLESFFSNNSFLTFVGLSKDGYINGTSHEKIDMKYFPEFTFEINGKISIVLNSSTYLSFNNGGKSFEARIRMNNENHVVLGGPFLNRVHVVFDYDKKQIGLAEYIHKQCRHDQNILQQANSHNNQHHSGIGVCSRSVSCLLET